MLVSEQSRIHLSNFFFGLVTIISKLSEERTFGKDNFIEIQVQSHLKCCGMNPKMF
jgi:hypothetical protein